MVGAVEAVETVPHRARQGCEQRVRLLHVQRRAPVLARVRRKPELEVREEDDRPSVTAAREPVADPERPVPADHDQAIHPGLIDLADGLALAARASLKKGAPSGVQNVFEVIFDGLSGYVDEIMGPHGHAYFTLIGTLFLFILTSNILGLIPGFNSPTANINTTAALAITVPSQLPRRRFLE